MCRGGVRLPWSSSMGGRVLGTRGSCGRGGQPSEGAYRSGQSSWLTQTHPHAPGNVPRVPLPLCLPERWSVSNNGHLIQRYVTNTGVAGIEHWGQLQGNQVLNTLWGMLCWGEFGVSHLRYVTVESSVQHWGLLQENPVSNTEVPYPPVLAQALKLAHVPF